MDNQEINKLKQAEEATLVTNNSLDGTSAVADAEDPLAPTTKVTRTPRVSQNSTIEINPFLLAGLLVGVVVVWLLVASLKQIFHTNPYGKQIKIDNFSQYFRGMPENGRDSLFNSLYIAVDNNTENIQIPKKGAHIREDSSTSEYDSKTDTYTSTFLVDIPELQQTYSLWAYWSTNPDNTYVTTASYTGLVFCPTEEQLIYPAFKCSDSRTEQGVSIDPIISITPIKSSYYTDNYAEYISYSITAKMSDDNSKLTLVISSYSKDTQASYNAALQKIKEKGFDPNKYAIEYIDQSSSFDAPARTDN